MKPMPLALLSCALILAAPVLADDPAPAFVELKAPEAIELVAKQADAAKADPKKKPITVLDVRTPDEFSKGHLANAVNVDFHDDQFKEAIAKLDKSKPYLVHCAAGGRSAKTRDLMKSLGFKTVYHLEGGMKAWEAAGGPVKTPEKP